MKKLFTIYLCMSFVFVQAQDSTKTDTTSLTILKVYNDTKAGITGLAKALKEPVNHIYHVMVLQQRVEAIVKLLYFVIGITLILTWFKAARRNERWWNEDEAPTIIGVARVIHALISLGLLLSGIFNIQNIVMGIFNPEYGAIKDIISFIK